MENSCEQLRQKYEEFFENKVRDLLPKYNTKRRSDQPKVFSALGVVIGIALVFCSILLKAFESISIKISLVGLLLTFGCGLFLYFYNTRTGTEDEEIDFDYEIKLKTKLMPKFLAIFGRFEWFKLSNSIYRATMFTKSFWEFLKKEIIIPTNLFYNIDDVIEGYYKDVRIRIVETKIGICLKHLILLPFLIIPFVIVGVALFYLHF